ALDAPVVEGVPVFRRDGVTESEVGHFYNSHSTNLLRAAAHSPMAGVLPYAAMPPVFLQKGLNGLRRLRSGLPARRGISPEVPNDLFQALAAVYAFAARHVQGKSVLDLGCGTGSGSARLLAAGAASVVGVDPDPKSLAYARRRFAGPRFLNVAVDELPEA